ncbi:hypothetical protein [Sandaracinus amylolyticus]|uniref:Uncharacterized protein n=1 Tax=Sandaracinus amylolyticus TaxID=927083 RepID=A0A0F6W9W0_9BACT|nr:hypothetical protein [Sandaracinus amylolyticus]AKF11156.1 hypothetical protein DB32_008305 [Sandaracinus amylolyticus]
MTAALALGAAPSCGGTETGNPPFAPDMGGGGYDPMGLSPDPAVESALISVEEAKLEDCEGAQVPLLRRAVLDAVGGQLRVLEPLEVPAGLYCAIELSIAACEDPDRCRTIFAPYAVSIDGTRRADGASIEVRDATRFVVRLEGSFDVTPDAGGLLLAVDRTLLTSGLSLSSIPAVDGVVLVDETTNADRLPALRAGLQSAMTLRRDLDGDATLDPEEIMAAPLAQPPE